jgi:hypothetical protein
MRRKTEVAQWYNNQLMVLSLTVQIQLERKLYES